MSGPTRHSHRARLAEAPLADKLLAGSLLYTSIQVVNQTGSTNADLLAAARSGAAAGTVLVAEEQTAGRGRLDRSWQSEPGASLTFSVLLGAVLLRAVLLGAARPEEAASWPASSRSRPATRLWWASA